MKSLTVVMHTTAPGSPFQALTTLLPSTCTLLVHCLKTWALRLTNLWRIHGRCLRRKGVKWDGRNWTFSVYIGAFIWCHIYFSTVYIGRNHKTYTEIHSSSSFLRLEGFVPQELATFPGESSTPIRNTFFIGKQWIVFGQVSPRCSFDGFKSAKLELALL